MTFYITDESEMCHGKNKQNYFSYVHVTGETKVYTDKASFLCKEKNQLAGCDFLTYFSTFKLSPLVFL